MKSIIVKKTAVNEFDEQVVCYTEEKGKITAVARSILKPHSKQAMHLDILNLVDFELVNGSAGWRLPIITSAQASHAYLGIKSSLAKTAAASFFMEVIDKVMYEHEKDPGFWEFMLLVLSELEKMPEPEVENFFRNAQNRLAKIMGYGSKFNDFLSGHRFVSLGLMNDVVK